MWKKKRGLFRRHRLHTKGSADKYYHQVETDFPPQSLKDQKDLLVTQLKTSGIWKKGFEDTKQTFCNLFKAQTVWIFLSTEALNNEISRFRSIY